MPWLPNPRLSRRLADSAGLQKLLEGFQLSRELLLGDPDHNRIGQLEKPIHLADCAVAQSCPAGTNRVERKRVSDGDRSRGPNHDVPIGLVFANFLGGIDAPAKQPHANLDGRPDFDRVLGWRRLLHDAIPLRDSRYVSEVLEHLLDRAIDLDADFETGHLKPPAIVCRLL